MNELQVKGLALELIDLVQARGALPGDAISAFSLAVGSLIAKTSRRGSRETVLQACVEVITEMASTSEPDPFPQLMKRRTL